MSIFSMDASDYYVIQLLFMWLLQHVACVNGRFDFPSIHGKNASISIQFTGNV